MPDGAETAPSPTRFESSSFSDFRVSVLNRRAPGDFSGSIIKFQTAAVVDDILGLQASRLVRQWFTGVQEWVFASHRGGNQYQHAVPASGLPSWFCRDFESLASASCLYSVVLGKHLPCGRANGFAPHWPCFPSAAQRSPLLFSGKKMNHCPICGKLGGQRSFLRHMTPLPKVRDL